MKSKPTPAQAMPLNLSSAVIRRGWQPGDPAQHWTPDRDQKKAVKFLLEHACAMILADPGVGKTSISLAAFKILKDQGVAKRALIIAPINPMNLVWPQELKRWLDFNHFTYQVLHGPDKEELLDNDCDINITNFESLQWLIDWEVVKVGKKFRVQVNPESATRYQRTIADKWPFTSATAAPRE